MRVLASGALVLLLTISSQSAHAAKEKIDINCASGDSIQQAIKQSDLGKKLVLKIIGTCTENVVIERNNVKLKGQGTLNGSLEIARANGIELKNVTFSGSPGIGILARVGSAVQTDNIEVRDFVGDGFVISDGSSMRMENSRVFMSASSTGFAALGAFDNSNIRLINSVIQSDKTAPFSGVALSAGRSSNVRVEDGNQITNTTGPNIDTTESLAVYVFDGANVRLQRAGNTVTGNVRLESLSTGDLRNFAVTGNFELASKSHMTVGQGATIAGNVLVDRQSLLEAFGSAGGIMGNVTCNRQGAVAVDLGLGITLVNCTNL